MTARGIACAMSRRTSTRSACHNSENALSAIAAMRGPNAPTLLGEKNPVSDRRSRSCSGGSVKRTEWLRRSLSAIPLLSMELAPSGLDDHLGLAKAVTAS